MESIKHLEYTTQGAERDIIRKRKSWEIKKERKVETKREREHVEEQNSVRRMRKRNHLEEKKVVHVFYLFFQSIFEEEFFGIFDLIELDPEEHA